MSSRKWFLLILLFVLAAACQAEPDLSTTQPGGACQMAQDCVWAVLSDECCSCGAVYPRAQVEKDKNLVILDLIAGEPITTASFTPGPDCVDVACSPCPAAPVGLVCETGVCRQASWWYEKLQICLGDEHLEAQTACLLNTAATAYIQAGISRALEVCDLVSGTSGFGMTYREFCLAEVGGVMSEQQPEQAVDYCRTTLDKLESACLTQAAQSFLRVDAGEAYQVCYQIEVRNENDQAQRDACFLTIAVEVGEEDAWLALRACNRIEFGREECRAIVTGD